MRPARTSGDPKEKGSKKRFGFTIARDISLLRSALQHNPFQLGSAKWLDVAAELKTAFDYPVTERTVKDRVFHLKEQYAKQELISKTGTEEEKSERGKLLESIIAIYEESVVSINEELGADQEMDFADQSGTPSSSARTAQKQLRKERSEADRERENVANALVPETVPSKRKKSRMMPEDEMIKTKLEHDMEIEKERLRIEQEKTKQDYEIETRKFDLEMQKFEFERERERRVAEEGQRRDELARMQIAFQEQLIKILSKMGEK